MRLRSLGKWVGKTKKSACALPWDRWPIATIMRCARVFSRRLNASHWQGGDFARKPKRAWRSSNSLKPGTIRIGGIQPSNTVPRLRSNRHTIHPHCPRLPQELLLLEKSLIRNYLRGRDAHYCAPPAQIRASGIPALGSHLGCLTTKRASGHGCKTRGCGNQRSAYCQMRFQVTYPR